MTKTRGLNLIEAIKSGRPFRRKSVGDDGYGWLDAGGDGYDFIVSEILADDYILKPAEPIVFETEVNGVSCGMECSVDHYRLNPLARKRVRVTIEELPNEQ